jgi:hypothetical protein
MKTKQHHDLRFEKVSLSEGRRELIELAPKEQFLGQHGRTWGGARDEATSREAKDPRKWEHDQGSIAAPQILAVSFCAGPRLFSASISDLSVRNLAKSRSKL